HGIRTIVFDPASFLMPRRSRVAKTDRLDAEGMTRILRRWLSGDREMAREVQIPSVAQEDAKRIERERKYLVDAGSGALRTPIPAHCGQRSGDCGQFLMSV
ncbi:MAG: hypothetical protein OEY13_16765, partial [Gammaproteobacteria bacterium]|nr:hypothetical protein [Gammaproteobacteria bacterium]